MAYLGNDLQVAFPSYRNIDDISGGFDGIETSFALTVGGVAPIPAPINSQQCLISVNGVVQRPDDSGTEGFRLSGGNIIFASAPTGGVDFFGVILAGADYVNVGVNFPSGNAAAPSITFDSDLDTGIYSPASNEIGFTTGGTRRLVVNSSGQISSGLGTAAAPAFSFISDPDTGFYSPGTNQIAFSTDSSERIRIGANGEIGLSGTNYGTSGQVLTSAGSGAAPTWQTPAAGAGDKIEEGNTSVEVIDTGSDGRVVFTTEGTEHARIDSSGRLLMGTSVASGGNLLQLNSDALIYGLTIGRGAGGISTNTAVGSEALAFNTTGFENTANGDQALKANTSGSNNTANGSLTLRQNTTGYNNTANGSETLLFNNSGWNNTANGFRALRANVGGSHNAANGVYALFSNNSGSYNTANGSYTLYQNTSGRNNSANGFQALYHNTLGSYNTAAGYNALFDNTSGSGNVCLGSATSTGAILPVFNCTTQNDRVVIGTTAVTNAYVQVAWTVVSDARDKMNFGVVPHGLEFIKQLNPISFQFKETRELETPHGPVRYGFKAQDILALEGEDNAVIIDNEDPDKLRYNGEALVPVLVNAIKEQQTIIDALTARLDAAGI